MSKMFDSYENLDKNYQPSNRPDPFKAPLENKDTISPGGTCTNIFRLPYFNKELLQYSLIQAVYYQGTEFRLVKQNSDFTIYTDKDGDIFIECELSPEETAKFNCYNQDAKCQLRIIIASAESGESLFAESGEESGADTVLYSKVFKIKVLPTLIKETIYG